MESQKINREQKLYVKGMHCASCEIIIEKKLLKQEGVQAADASLRDSEVRIVIADEKKIDLNRLNSELSELGYSLSKDPVIQVNQPLISKDSNGQTKINKDKAKKYLFNFGLALLMLVAFILVEKAQLGRLISINQSTALSAFLILGLVASVSSCAALIGGVLLSLSKHWHEQYGDNPAARKKPHLMFHIGRLVSFFVLGGLLGGLGNLISLDNSSIYAYLIIIISILMLLVALQMLGVGWAQRFTLRLPKSFTRLAANENTSPSFIMPAVAGGLTFFLPCGFTLIAQGAALASGNLVTGAYIMLFFAFGTLPMLAGISFSGIKFTSKPHLAARFSVVAGVLILFFAIYNINGQLNVLGLASLSDLGLFRSTDSEASFDKPAPVKQGTEQQIKLVAKDFDYIPVGSTSFTAGVPTKLVVDNQGIVGCGATLTARGLINGFTTLKKGQNIIDLGSPQAGTYKITCSMGMVLPVTITFKK